MIDDNYFPARHQPIVCRAGVPVPDVLACEFRKSVLHARIRIIDENAITTAAKHAATNAKCIINAARASVPLALCLAIFSQFCIFEDRLVFWTVDRVSHSASEITCEPFRCGDGEKLLVGLATEIPSRKTMRGQF